MKTILILGNSALVLYKFRKELICTLLKRRNQVVLSTPKDHYFVDLQSLGATIIELNINRHGANPFHEFMLYITYRNLMKSLKPDIVLTYTIKPNIYGNLAAKSFGIPVISTVTGLGETFINDNTISRIARLLYRWAFSRTSCVAFQNKEDEEIMCRAGIVKNQRVMRVPGSGVNLEEFRQCDMPELELIRFLYSGRLMKNKGIVELLTATKRLHSEYPGVFEVLLAGYFDDDLGRKVKDAEDDGVRYLGFVSNMKDLLESCHCIVLPSYKEGMSNILLEAASTGRPLIATNVSGCREIVDDNINGFLCKPYDANSLYDCMKRFIELSNEQRAEMGTASRRKVEIEFDRNLVIQYMLEQVENLV